MSLSTALAEIVGASQVLESPDLRAPYETDWTGRFSGSALAVVRPGSTDEVAAVLRACSNAGAAVVPQGGNTGLVGGSTPRGGEVVVSTTRLDALAPVDVALGQVRCGAGVRLASLQKRAAAAGFDAGIDLAPRESATVGGLVACDAGGARALRHGTARARVAGLEAVLPGGARIERMSGVLKDNAGLDLPSLLVGSEGILGIITAVVWRLVPAGSSRVAALVPAAGIDDAVRLLESLRLTAPALEACDFVLAAGLELSARRRGVPSPLRDAAPVGVFVELASDSDPTAQLVAALEAAGVPVDDVAIADSTAERERLWGLREGLTEAIAAEGVPHKMDVGVPLAELGRFIDEAPEVVSRICPGATTHLFGHLGDGNVHVNVLGGDDRVDGAVLDLVLECGGTISAEHGVGVVKTAWLEALRGADEVAVLRGVARAFDPDGLMNPGVVLPPLADQ